VVGVAGEAIADHFAINLGATSLGALVILEHHDAGAFAHDETVAVLVVGPRCSFGMVVEVGGQRASGGEAGEREAIDQRFGAAGHHHVGIAKSNQPGGIANGVRAGGAGRHH
jgi:hypothetical protein